MATPYMKQWRKFRHYTQDQVVDRLAGFDDPNLPQTAASLSRIENGKQPYSQRIVEALSEIYQCEPHELIGRNPEMAGEVIDLLVQLSEAQRRQIKVIIEAIAKEAG